MSTVAASSATAMKQTKIKSEMRAPPRRRQKLPADEGSSEQDQPVFLRKAFKMITTCPPEIGGWSEKGDTMIIKDIKRFAESIIPTAYKHNNFSSFVRQLNFYGFRKIKSESIERSDWWEFRHPQFKRDQPHLLSEIKRSVHFETTNNEEVSSLKSEVTGLNDRIAALHKQIDELSGVVEGMKLKEEEKERRNDAALGPMDDSSLIALGIEPSKKRRVTYSLPSISEPPAVVRQTSLGAATADIPSGQEMNLDNEDFFNHSKQMSGPPSLERVNSLQRVMSITSDSADMAWFDDLTMLEDLDDARAMQSNSIPLASAVTSSPQPTGTVQNISSVLESLSPELKVRFVDKLAEVMGKQLSSDIAQQTATAVEAVPAEALQQKKENNQIFQTYNTFMNSTPAQSAMMPSKSPSGSTYRLPCGEQAPEIALPLASAALGAFVVSSLQSIVSNQQQGASKPPPHIKEEVM